MKPLITRFGLLAIAACLALSPQLKALTIGDSHYIGHVDDGIPSNPSNEATYINTLKGLAPGATATPIGTETYDRVGSTLSTAGFPTATDVGSVSDNSGNNVVDVTGYTYLLGKYDAGNAGSYVWYVGDLTGLQTIPATAGQYGLSHWALFNPRGGGVPDGGTTVTLLGLAIAALAFAKRRLAI
jgi:hypothetical protein